MADHPDAEIMAAIEALIESHPPEQRAPAAVQLMEEALEEYAVVAGAEAAAIEALQAICDILSGDEHEGD